MVLYIEPHDRVAYWTEWRLLGLGKQHWDGVHALARNVSTAASSCSRARLAGFWALKPSSRSTRHRWPMWYVTSNSFSTTFLTRLNVHNSVGKPAARAPLISVCFNSSRRLSESFGRLPPCGLGSSPAGPLWSKSCSPRVTEAGAHPMTLATARVDSSVFRSATACRRRASSSPFLPFGRMRMFDHAGDPESSANDPLVVTKVTKTSTAPWSMPLRAR